MLVAASNMPIAFEEVNGREVGSWRDFRAATDDLAARIKQCRLGELSDGSFSGRIKFGSASNGHDSKSRLSCRNDSCHRRGVGGDVLAVTPKMDIVQDEASLARGLKKDERH